MTDNIRDVARREHAAEQTRDQAEAAWRAAWWDTTLALAAVVADGHGAVRDACLAVVEELGYKLDRNGRNAYVQKRRETGAAVDQGVLEHSLIRSLPPRLAMQYVQSGRLIDQTAAEDLLAKEAAEVSIRDLAREQGTQPASWQRADERELTPAQREEIVRAEIERSPDRVQEILDEHNPYPEEDPAARHEALVQTAREALTNPAVAREALADPAVRRAVVTDRVGMAQLRSDEGEMLAERYDLRFQRPDPEFEQTHALGELATALLYTVQRLQQAHRLIADMPLDEGVVRMVTSQTTKITALSDALRERVEGGREFDDELRALLDDTPKTTE